MCLVATHGQGLPSWTASMWTSAVQKVSLSRVLLETTLTGFLSEFFLSVFMVFFLSKQLCGYYKLEVTVPQSLNCLWSHWGPEKWNRFPVAKLPNNTAWSSMLLETYWVSCGSTRGCGIHSPSLCFDSGVLVSQSWKKNLYNFSFLTASGSVMTVHMFMAREPECHLPEGPVARISENTVWLAF